MNDATDLDARYGRRPPTPRRRKVALAVGGVVLAVLAVLAFWLWWLAEQDPYSARVQSFDVLSDARVDVSVEITTSGPDPVRCEVVAQDSHSLVVGTAVVESAVGPEVQVLVTPVATTARAVVAQVRDCTTAPARVP